jgi:hypothetical protein
MLIQAFLSEVAVEGRDVGVIRGFPQLGELQRDIAPLGPRIQCLRDVLRVIVDRDSLRHADRSLEAVQHRDHALTFDRRVDLDGWAHSAHVIQCRRRPKATAIDQAIGQKVDAPALIRLLWPLLNLLRQFSDGDLRQPPREWRCGLGRRGLLIIDSCHIGVVSCDRIKQLRQVRLNGKAGLQGIECGISGHLGRIDVEFLLLDEAGDLALLDDLCEKAAEDVEAIAVADARQAGVVRQWLS